MTAERRLWEELVDREAVGETLTAEEEHTVRRVEDELPECRHERALWDELAATTERGPMPGDSRALVERVLAEAAAPTPAEPPRARSRRLVAALGLATLVAAAAVVVLAWPRDPAPAPAAIAVGRAEVVHVVGDAAVDGAPAKLGALAEGTMITTDAGEACIVVDPGIDVCIGASSRMVVSAIAGPARRVELEAGTAVARLDPQLAGSSFAIASGGVEVTAVGTVFAVEHDGEGEGTVALVLEGEVAVAGAHGKTSLLPHQRVQVKGGTVEVRAATRAEESAKHALLPPSSPWDQGEVVALEVRSRPDGATVMLDGAPIGRAPLSTLVAPGAHELALSLSGHRSERRELTATGPTLRIDVELAIETPEPAPVEPPPPEVEPVEPPTRAARPTAAVLLEQARDHLRAGRRDSAARAYQDLVRFHPRSPEAHAVLVALGDLQLDLGRARAALRAYDRYLAGGGGALEREARLGRVRAHRKLGDRAGERAAIEAFLARHPESGEAGKLRERLRRLDELDLLDPARP